MPVSLALHISLLHSQKKLLVTMSTAHGTVFELMSCSFFLRVTKQRTTSGCL